jgi:predicted DsbA family dithiol-disulfide isomerase
MTSTGKSGPKAVSLNLEVFSDFICPWCYVAHRRLAAARRALAGEVDVLWRPYELNPDMPQAGHDRREYRSAKFGSWERSQELDAGTVKAGAPDGVEFRYDLMTRTPSTLAAHRLVWSARDGGRQDEVVGRLFRAYFTEGRDIGDPAVLADIAQAAGVPGVAPSELATATAAVREQQARAQSLGLTGVPFHLVDGRYSISGAVPASELVRLLRRAAQGREAAA